MLLFIQCIFYNLKIVALSIRTLNLKLLLSQSLQRMGMCENV